jgi:hypothetical protein
MRAEFLADLIERFFVSAMEPLLARFEVIEAWVAKVAAQPPPAQGEPGPAGKDGRDGEPGEPGKDGRDGVDGKDGMIGKDGRDGVDGRSVTAEDLRPMFEGEFAKYALTYERQMQATLQRAVDQLPRPKDGRDGADGMGFDDLEMLYDGERTFTFRMQRGDRIKERAFKFPLLLERGIYEAGRQYELGDGVTWGGSFWIAQKDTSSRPGEQNADWRLTVKKGRDGKDGRDGEKGDRGETGARGRDLTQMGQDGSKWS